MGRSLSVVMPVHDEASHLPATIGALLEAVERSGFEAELVLVDDGSTDGSAEVVRGALRDHLPLTVVAQPNSGRFKARRAGIETARGDWVLLLDGRVRLAPDALRFVHDRLHAGASVWNGHVQVEADRNPYGAFWRLLGELAWAEYFDNPRETSFGGEEFDRYPKGTGCFLAPRELLLAAVEAAVSRYSDSRFANDDTPVLRWIAEREHIHLSPRFPCVYRPRQSLGAFVRHSHRRGIVFLDGHGRRESRLFPAVLAFYPVSTLVALVAVRRPAVVPLVGVSLAVAAGVFASAKRRTRFEAASFAVLAPLYAFAHGTGMWRGLAMLLRERRDGLLETSFDCLGNLGPPDGRGSRLEPRSSFEEVDERPA